MQKNSKIYVAGHRGLVGSAIVNNLKAKGYTNVIGRTHSELDLLDQNAVKEFFETEKPDYVFLAAAKVGGIVANNTYRADFIYENLQIQNNIIHQSYLNGVKKLMFLGSTCIYPKNCPQPMKEEYLLTSELEYTNEPYAIAKIAGIKMCESYNLQYGTNYISVMPTNLYGPNDNFDLEKSHVLPALIRKVHLGKALEENNWEAIRNDLNKLPIEGIDGSASEKEILSILDKYGIKSLNIEHSKLNISIEIWGSGNPKREFLYSTDMADACVFLMENRDFKDIISQQFTNTPITNNLSLSQSTITQPMADEKSCEALTQPQSLSQSTITEVRNTHINIGTGTDISIKDLAYMIKDLICFNGELYFNTDKPDGTMKKLTDVSKLHSLGWKHSVELKDGIEKIYTWYLGNS
ncbi:GDP-L-fucose synthase family protein [Sulfurovum lithotrophicum]|uniref:GDP-L-fucose synthase family protein n=1 Tax=Sulfurovum lithotrophicum TaxID=206403 RepID=UPI0009FE0C7D|nr:GDP-L-fucose synthase [Sulfurovum lithotrophicum]